MPDWSIKIVELDSGETVFVPDLAGAQPGDPLHAWQDDLVSWNNTTDKKHQPWPTDSSYKPLPKSKVTRDSPNYMSDVIFPGTSSTPAYDVQGPPQTDPPSKTPPQTWNIYYCCKKHPTEQGFIIVTPVPTS